MVIKKAAKKTVAKKTVRKKAAVKKAAPKKTAGMDVDKLVKSINKEAKRAVASTGRQMNISDVTGYLSTGCLPMDCHMGQGLIRGGYPLGGVVELFGEESHGKSTLATQAMISAQQGKATLVDWEPGPNGILRPKVKTMKTDPGLVFLIDSESTFDRRRAQKMGLNLDRFVPMEAEHVEEGFGCIDHVLSQISDSTAMQDVPVVIVWDTIAACPSKSELDGKIFGEGMASKPRLIRSALRRITRQLARTNVLLIIVNQVIDNLRSRVGGKTTPGGRGIKHHAAVRMEIRRIGNIIERQRAVGIETKVKLIKSKVCVPFVEFDVPLRYKTGIDSDTALLEYMLNRKIDEVKTASKGWYQVKGSKKKFRYADWPTILKETKGLRVRCRRAVMESVAGEY